MPDDIETADAGRLARLILGMESLPKLAGSPRSNRSCNDSTDASLMYDQANELRQLVRQQVPRRLGDSAGARPRLVVVAGGKGGVGTTTVAVNLAVALARAGRRTVLVDADPDGGDVAMLCGLDERHTLADVLAGAANRRRGAPAGPGGLQVLPGAWALASEPANARRRRRAADRRSSRASATGPTSWSIDAGNGRSRLARRFWQAADLVLLVTTPELAVGDGRLRRRSRCWRRRGNAGPIHTLVNQARRARRPPTTSTADLAEACRRFLGVRLVAGWATSPTIRRWPAAGKAASRCVDLPHPTADRRRAARPAGRDAAVRAGARRMPRVRRLNDRSSDDPNKRLNATDENRFNPGPPIADSKEHCRQPMCR